MAIKITATLDEATVASLNRIAARLRKPKSAVLREAIQAYETASDRLTESERRRMVKVIEEYKKQPQTRSQADADREQREIRESRRRGWSRPSDNT